MRPKFEVGEVVILQSKDFPHLNGEYIVDYCSVGVTGTRVMYRDKYYRHNKSSVAYFLDGVYDESGSPLFFSESALRKKHQPGELNFRQLMSSLSSPKLITHHS